MNRKLEESRNLHDDQMKQLLEEIENLKEEIRLVKAPKTKGKIVVPNEISVS